MECSKCKTQMEKGTLASHGQIWSPKILMTLAKWIPGLGKSKLVHAWACPKCGYVELQRELN